MITVASYMISRENYIINTDYYMITWGAKWLFEIKMITDFKDYWGELNYYIPCKLLY